MLLSQATQCTHSSHIAWEKTSSKVEASSALHSSGSSLLGADSRSYVLICSVSGDAEVSEVLSLMCLLQPSMLLRGLLGPRSEIEQIFAGLLFAYFTVNGNLWVLIIMPHRENTTGSHFNKEIHLFLYLGPYLCSFLSKWSVPKASLNV